MNLGLLDQLPVAWHGVVLRISADLAEHNLKLVGRPSGLVVLPIPDEPRYGIGMWWLRILSAGDVMAGYQNDVVQFVVATSYGALLIPYYEWRDAVIAEWRVRRARSL